MSTRRRFRCAPLIAIPLLLLALPLCIATMAGAAGKSIVVTMTDTPPRYVPDKLKISVGTTVEWKNTGQTLHDVTTVAALAQKKSDVELPAGAKPFDSGFMPPGGTFQHTFIVSGHYVYVCIPHEKDGMVGEVEVTK
jgi:plastocyanin